MPNVGYMLRYVLFQVSRSQVDDRTLQIITSFTADHKRYIDYYCWTGIQGEPGIWLQVPMFANKKHK